MSPTLLTLLVQGALQIFTDKKAFKENLTAPATKASLIPAIVGLASVAEQGLVPADSLEGAITQVVSGLLFVGLFLLRKYKA